MIYVYTSLKLNFGGLIVTLMELDFFSEKLSNQKIIFCITNKNMQKNDFKNLNDNLINGFLLNFSVKFLKSLPTSSIDINKIFSKSNSYSFSFLNYLNKKNKFYPIILFNKNIKKNVSNFLSKYKIKNFITLHLKETNQKKDISSVNYKVWVQSFDKLKVTKNYYILIVGNNSINKFNLKNKKIIDANLKLNLAEQFYLVSISNYFIGMASGFSCSANFSKVPYMILKHPNHHREIIKEELEDKKIPFSRKKQDILFVKQDIQQLSKILRKALND